MNFYHYLDRKARDLEEMRQARAKAEAERQRIKLEVKILVCLKKIIKTNLGGRRRAPGRRAPKARTIAPQKRKRSENT